MAHPEPWHNGEAAMSREQTSCKLSPSNHPSPARSSRDERPDRLDNEPDGADEDDEREEAGPERKSAPTMLSSGEMSAVHFVDEKTSVGSCGVVKVPWR